jgi:hypothetical protein
VSGRLDWNLRTKDRVFLLIQYDHGQFTNYVDSISPIFDSYSHQPTWQGQLNETHTFSPTAANQFLLAGTYVKSRTGVANSAQALAAFPVTLNWWNEGQAFSVYVKTATSVPTLHNGLPGTGWKGLEESPGYHSTGASSPLLFLSSLSNSPSMNFPDTVHLRHPWTTPQT